MTVYKYWSILLRYSKMVLVIDISIFIGEKIMNSIEGSLKEIQDTLKGIEELVTVPSILEQSNNFYLTLVIILAAAILEYWVRRKSPNAEDGEYYIARRKYYTSSIATFALLVLTCFSGSQIIYSITMPSIINFATLGALYYVLLEQNREYRSIYKEFKSGLSNDKSNEISLKEKVDNLQESLNLMKIENEELKIKIDELVAKESDRITKNFSLITINTQGKEN